MVGVEMFESFLWSITFSSPYFSIEVLISISSQDVLKRYICAMAHMDIFRKMCIVGVTVLALGCNTPNGVSRDPLATVTSSVATATPTSENWHKTALAIFKPVKVPEVSSEEMVELGRMLYFDPRLSKSGTISCNSCHALDRYGVDGEPTSPGHEGKRGARNSPSVYNAGLHFRQFWDGRAKDLEEQASGPVMNPVEMGLPDEAAVTKILEKVPEYRQRFAELFPGQDNPLTLGNAAKAIAAFEQGLVTPSRFDSYLLGDEKAITAEELAGAKTFVEVGCASCHSGVALGGSAYQKMGLKRPFESQDTGRFEVTQKEADRGKFKVPSLRNITETGPYLHDGSVASLDEVVRLMGQHQLDKDLSEQEIHDITAFLNSLKGELPQSYIAAPELPK